jgi:4'-phosphopantetheinyl transferase EntD
MVGSITHCAGIAAAAVAWEEDLAGLGLDLEPLDRPLGPGVAGLVCHDSELGIGPAALTPEQRLLAIFSAKEAIYKAVFPIGRVYLDFLDAELRWLPERDAFHATLLKPAGVDGPLEIRIGRLDRWLAAATWVPASKTSLLPRRP